MRTVVSVPGSIRDAMRGRTWHEDPRCPPFDELRLVRPRFVDFEGVIRTGELVTAATIADEVAEILDELLRLRFPIRRMERVDRFEGSDDASMEADNCSCFNFRTIPGSPILSHHALGLAVDVNPRENPMILRGVVHPPSALPFVDRASPRPGMFLAGGAPTEAFLRRGWEWGGDWPDLRDYHHFSRRRRGT